MGPLRIRRQERPPMHASGGSWNGTMSMPFGHQGEATVENISLRCRAHNVYESEITFGPWVARESSENYAVSREFASFRNDGAADSDATTRTEGQEDGKRVKSERDDGTGTANGKIRSAAAEGSTGPHVAVREPDLLMAGARSTGQPWRYEDPISHGGRGVEFP